MVWLPRSRILLFSVLVLVVGYGLVSPTYAQTQTLQIPKLSYGPTLSQLITDANLPGQMLIVDMQVNHTAPVSGKAAIGFDNTNLDIIFDYTTQTTKPASADAFAGIDKVAAGKSKPDSNDFEMGGLWFANGTKWSGFWVGTGSDWKDAPIPNGFSWDESFAQSYFSPQNHIVFVFQIPNSYIGPGGPSGKYRIDVGVSNDVNATIVPGYPADADDTIPSTWGIFATQYPIPEFGPTNISLTAVVIAFVLCSIAFLRRRKGRCPIFAESEEG